MITANIWYLTNSDWLYSYNWGRNDVPAITTLPIAELDSAADQIKDYFNNRVERLEIYINYPNAGRIQAFSEVEILHMYDVKNLMRIVYYLMIVTGVILALSILATIYFARKRFFKITTQILVKTAILAVVVALFFGIYTAIDFNSLFITFHRIAFTNDFWLLNPNTDLLIQLFPYNFWFETMVILIILVVVQFILLWLVGHYVNLKVESKAKKD